MKRLILLSLMIFTFFTIVQGQSYEYDKPSSNSPFITSREDIKSNFDSKDLNFFIGNWVSLDNVSEFQLYQNGNEILSRGNYFPGVLKNGDKAKLIYSEVNIVEPIDKEKELSISNSKSSIGYRLHIKYSFKSAYGDGEKGVDVSYSALKDHLIVEPPPIYCI